MYLQQAPEENWDNYDTLVDYLMEDAKTDLAKVRSIFAWIGSVKIESRDMGEINVPHSPRGYMAKIKEGTGSYATLFTILCR